LGAKAKAVVAPPLQQTTAADGSAPAADLRVGLLGKFELTSNGESVEIPTSAQRLLALLALKGRQLPRAVVAGQLWSEATEDQSQSSLRSALWRLQRSGHVLIDVSPGVLRLADAVAVDTHEIISTTRALIEEHPHVDPNLDPGTLTRALLPGWYEDWVVIERERLRQLCLHGLESLARRLVDCRRYARAIEVSLATVGCEPLRESAHRILIQAHLKEGNRSEAIRQYRRFADLLRDELDIEPSPSLTELIRFA
jgi:DNA-binding SARP family transcriptional activator